jgi:F420-non-reducing hydrogenase iron-sulfur subunit
MNDKKFEPKIIAFCCHYCAYASADLAGSMRLQYPAGVRIIRTPCTGRLEVEFYLRAFEHGADGVMVAGCLEGGCHFIDGNLFAKKRVNSIKTILEEIGIEKERMRMINISAAMATNLVAEIDEMVKTIKELGPSPIKNNGIDSTFKFKEFESLNF